jgi:hypothetical protein
VITSIDHGDNNLHKLAVTMVKYIRLQLELRPQKTGLSSTPCRMKFGTAERLLTSQAIPNIFHIPHFEPVPKLKKSLGSTSSPSCRTPVVRPTTCEQVVSLPQKQP